MFRWFSVSWARAAAFVLCFWAGPSPTVASAQSLPWPLVLFESSLTDWVYSYLRDYRMAEAADDDVRLATLPDMFGDSFAPGGVLVIENLGPDYTATTDVVFGQGLRVSKLNKAIPMDRVYASYSHFHHAARAETTVPPGTVVAAQDSSIDQYLIGVERRLGDGLWSLELRMPLSGGYSFDDPLGNVRHGADEIGNLSAILKRLLYYNGCTSIVAGLGIETPTGGDFESTNSVARYRVENDVVHLHPYLGVLRSSSSRTFYHGFAQLDVATAGNRVTFADSLGSGVRRYSEQTLLYLDFGGGYSLYRNQCAPVLTGISALLEVHYTGTLGGTDLVAAERPGSQSFTLSDSDRHVVNTTAALHLDLGGKTHLRFGGVFPLTDGANRFFDGEFAAQLVRRY